jgi:hypothetical protein
MGGGARRGRSGFCRQRPVGRRVVLAVVGYKRSDCTISFSCLLRSVNSIARRRNWRARLCAAVQAAHGALRGACGGRLSAWRSLPWSGCQLDVCRYPAVCACCADLGQLAPCLTTQLTNNRHRLVTRYPSAVSDRRALSARTRAVSLISVSHCVAPRQVSWLRQTGRNGTARLICFGPAAVN